jgi:putrescine transport system ATP-binding protein
MKSYFQITRGSLLLQTGFRLEAQLALTESDRVLLRGPSGIGKTSFLRGILGFERWSPETQIFLDGIEIKNLPPQARPIGWMVQGGGLFPHLSVFENVALPLRALGLGKKQIQSRVIEILDRVQAVSLLNRDIGSLSGGEIQRVALARTLLRSQKLLLLDEPWNGLDASSTQFLQDLVLGFCNDAKIPMICVTHQDPDQIPWKTKTFSIQSGLDPSTKQLFSI